MRPDKIINESRGFDPHAFFYSRTDKRGVIRSGNGIFFDVSGYDPEALIGAPHRIVRHPDMPRGLFHLLWAAIQAGEPMGAYVKNLAQDGRYYWVFAVLQPLDDGYISVRLGARGTLFEKTQAVYATMLKAEEAGMSPADSGELLLRELAALGFPGHRNYLAQLLLQHVGDPQRPDGTLSHLDRLQQSMGRVAESRNALIETLRTLYLIPTNMRILASRLEPSGGPVSAISDSYKRAAAELMARLNGAGQPGGAATGAEDGLNQITRAVIATGTAQILRDAVRQFSGEAAVAGVDHATESEALARLVADLEAASTDSTDQMMRTVAHISREAEHIKRLMAGLDQIRILGEVESGRLRNSDGGLAAVMAQLTSFHAQIHTRLTAMSNIAARMQAGGAI